MKKFLTILSLFFSLFLSAQTKIVVYGSSTAAGQLGVSSPDSGWVARLQAWCRRNTSDGNDTVVINKAVNGYTSYEIRETGFTPPTGRPSPDVLRNVTSGIAERPDPVLAIINMPSNDVVNGYPNSEIMANFRTEFRQLKAAGARVFITTTQPRSAEGTTNRQRLRDLKDSIINAFGQYSINFWDTTATTDGQNNIQSGIKFR
jgi:lysophospholipase L1-like esterase